MPTRSAPRSSPSPSARAALTVTPRSVSVAVIRNITHAMFIAVSSDAIGDVPGLQSVETAIGMSQRAQPFDRRQLGLAQNNRTRRAAVRRRRLARPCVAANVRDAYSR